MMKGWRLTIGLSLGLLLLTVLQLSSWGTDEEGIRVVIRSSARTSVVLFGLAFAASSLRTLWRHEATAWLLANRRFLGVSYAVSHAIHAAALLALASVSVEFRDGLDGVTLAGGGLAYLLTFAMAATSTDAAVRTLGRARWRALHLVGGWTIWIVFAQSYLPRAANSAAYLPFGIWIVGIAGLRAARWTRARRARTVRAA